MNLQQLRFVHEAVRRNLNLTEAARRLFTSQPGVSRQIRALEDELGVQIFVRRGKRLVALSEPGALVVQIIERALAELENLRQIGREFRDRDSGPLVVATTHTQARYALPRVVADFKRRFPKVHLVLQQGSPPQLAEMVIAGEADLAIATESLDHYPQLLALPAYTWTHSVVVPRRHALARAPRLTLEELARYPLVTYDPAFTGRTRIDAAFAARGLKPDVVLSAIDTDVIKTYVELGLGVGIIATMSFDAARDRALRKREAGRLFGTNTTLVAVHRDRLLRGYAYAFIERFAPRLSRSTIEQALRGAGRH